MKTFQLKLSLIPLSPELRCDEKYFEFAVTEENKLFNKDGPYISLKNILSIDYNNFKYEMGKEYKGLPTSHEYFDDDGDIINTLKVTKEKHPGRIKYSVSEGNILISSIKSAKVKAIYISKEKSKYIYSNGFFIFKIKKDSWNPKFVYYLLKSSRLRGILDKHLSSGIGISAYKDYDLLRIRIPKIGENIQNDVVKKIEKIEHAIFSYKQNYSDEQELINDFFEDYFKIKMPEINDKNFEIYFDNFSKSLHLRCSVKYNNPGFEIINRILSKLNKIRIKDRLEIPISLGISPVYDSDGQTYYITPGAMKSKYIEEDELRPLSDSFYEKAKENNKAEINDLLLRRSGVSIGKVALFDSDKDCIFSDFMMRIRFNEEVNPLFAYYYMRTPLFQLQILKSNKGMGPPNVFPTQVEQMYLIDISREEQNKFVETLHKKISENKELGLKLNKLREEIDCIITNAFN